jgi:hypothetical protein
MWNLLQVAAFLVLPALLAGGLLWILIYSSVRLALRHEVARLEQRKARAARTEARARAAGTARPRLVRQQPAAARAGGHARARAAS